jgi:glycosyltransferase involved in cell wall biosynthesis
VPTRNRSQRVREAVDSLLREPYTPLEILVVNDGSTDDTTVVLQEAYGKNDRVHMISLETSHGAAEARNVGVRNASGAFVTFLDDDDLNVPGRISGQVRLAQLHDADFVTCTRCYYRTGRSTSVMGTVKARITLDDMWFANRIVSVTPLVRTDLMRRTMFDPTLETGQDYDAWIRCLTQCTRTVNYSEPAIVYRRIDGPTITGNRFGKFRSRLKLFRRHHHLMDPRWKAWFLISTLLKAFIPDPRRLTSALREHVRPSSGLECDNVTDGDSGE